jgi:hypothetical protein
VIDTPRRALSRFIPWSASLRKAACILLFLAALFAADTGAFSGFSDGPRPQYGLLWLQIDPDNVSIALDGEYLDKDVWLISVAPGSHVLRVSKPGYLPRESRFDISPGQNVRLDVSLAPALE